MRKVRAAAVVATAVAGFAFSPLGLAVAGAHTGGGDLDGGPGGLLSNVSGRNSSGHANLCGTGKLALLKERKCVTEDHGHSRRGGDVTGPSGGVLSNLLFSRNSSGHSNNCGNETIAIISRTTCVTVQH